MEDPKQQLLAKLRDSANVLVTVTNNPSVDQLSGAIGLTLLLNKLGKHATAIFSGQVPKVMEFLKPEDTIEKTADSLRDFIIALDKAKADKLRYKVEDTMVKIFITPYHSALTEKDLEFSQGDYNVDLIVAIGAHEQRDLDQAITAHGQILHDAVISSVNNTAAGGLGTINWVDATASSLCEMLFELTRELQPEGLDPQMATALLTGIVSETRRFGNDKTTAKSLETSSLLVAAGANQQLVAAKLEDHPAPIPEKKLALATKPAAKAEEATATDTHKDPEAVPQTSGTVLIDHEDKKAATTDDDGEEIHIDEQGQLHEVDELPQAMPASAPTESAIEGGQKMLLEPPAIDGQPDEPPEDPTAVAPMPLLSHDSGPAKLPSEEPATTSDVDAAKAAVDTAANAMPDLIPKPRQALNAQNVDLDTPTPEEPTPPVMPAMSFASPAMPPAPVPAAESPTPPPAVPPPMSPTFATATAGQDNSQPQPNPSDLAL